MEQAGIYERIKDRVGQLRKESQDYFFTEYLTKLDSRLIQEKHQLDLMETELERSCRIYQQRMTSGEAVMPGAAAAAGNRQERGPGAVMPGTVSNTQSADRQNAASSGMSEAVPRLSAEKRSADAGTASGEMPTKDAGTAPEGIPAEAQEVKPDTVSSGVYQNVVPLEGQNISPGGMPSGGSQVYGTYSTGNFSRQTVPSFTYSQSQTASRNHRNHEFTIGINVFGAIGVLFVLAALILLGINYMSSLVKELGLYVLGLLVWGVAEFVLKKKNRTLSMIFSSLGIGSLYVTTMVNFLYLHNFNALVTISITTLVTAAVMFVSRKKDAGILRIICIGACMISFLMMDTLHMAGEMELLVYMGMIVLIQLLGIFLPVKQWAYGIALGQMAGTAFFAWTFAVNTIPPGEVMGLRALYVIGFVVISILLMELTVWRMPVSAQNSGQMQGICAAFGIGALLLLSAHWRCATGFIGLHNGLYSDIEIWIRLGVLAAIGVMGVLFFFLTKGKGFLPWMQAYFVAGAALFMFGYDSRERLSVTITLAVLLAVYKLLAYRLKPLWAADAVITTWTALVVLAYHDTVYGAVLLGVLLLGILLINHWQTYFELIFTGTALLYLFLVVDNELLLPLVVAVMWLATLLLNYVKRFAGKGIRGFNVTILVMEISCYLGLAFFQKYDSVIIYFILTVLGMGILLFTFRPGFFQKPEEWRGLAMAVFLTYMVLVTRFEYRITSSILMMVVGLLGILFGFRQTDRKLRIYGLVLCMPVCFKITLFDFRVQSLQRIILFLAAGAVALGISGIYAWMDKKYNRDIEKTE